MPQLVTTNTRGCNVLADVPPPILASLKVFCSALKVARLLDGNTVQLGEGFC